MIRRFAAVAALLAPLGLSACIGAPAPYPAPYGQPIAAAPGQPAPQQVAYGAHCFAGVYQCPLAQQLPVGAPCSCPGLGAPSYGNVR